MAWSSNWAESDQWELSNDEQSSHRLHVAQASEEADHNWYALAYIDDGEPFDEQYDLGLRKEFVSGEDAIRWSDDYCSRNPNGHPEHVVTDIRAKKPA